MTELPSAKITTKRCGRRKHTKKIKGMDWMKIYKKIMDGLAAVEKLVLMITGIGTTALTFINVCVRKFSDSQFAWTEELVVNFFVLLIMCGCALCAREGSLISLSLIYDSVSEKVRKVLTVIITVINLGFYVLVLKTGIDKVLTQMANGKRTSSLMWPEWVFTIFLPIGAVLLILHTVEFCVDQFAKKPEGKEIEGGSNA